MIIVIEIEIDSIELKICIAFLSDHKWQISDFNTISPTKTNASRKQISGNFLAKTDSINRWPME